MAGIVRSARDIVHKNINDAKVIKRFKTITRILTLEMEITTLILKYRGYFIY